MQENNPDLSKAVALVYDRERDNAPRIVASGRGEVARQIFSIAQEHSVPMHKNQSLVETLLRFEIGTDIPPELYKAIAEVFALVYKLDKKKGMEI